MSADRGAIESIAETVCYGCHFPEKHARPQAQRIIDALAADGYMVVKSGDDAVSLLEYALHLRMYGERAPGGNETWQEFDRRVEVFFQALYAPVPEGSEDGGAQ